MVHLLKNIARSLVQEPVTRPYPLAPREPFAGARGHITLAVEKCTFCTLCEKKCPANALKVTRKPDSWTLNPYACIVCGYCVEACPRKCIQMQTRHLPPASVEGV